MICRVSKNRTGDRVSGFRKQTPSLLFDEAYIVLRAGSGYLSIRYAVVGSGCWGTSCNSLTIFIFSPYEAIFSRLLSSMSKSKNVRLFSLLMLLPEPGSTERKFFFPTITKCFLIEGLCISGGCLSLTLAVYFTIQRAFRRFLF